MALCRTAHDLNTSSILHCTAKLLIKEVRCMSNTLIVGSGPVAIQLAQICSQVAHQTIDMVSR